MISGHIDIHIDVILDNWNVHVEVTQFAVGHCTPSKVESAPALDISSVRITATYLTINNTRIAGFI
jgi:hypothetical protein